MNDDVCMNNPTDTKQLLDKIFELLNIGNLDQDIEEVLQSSEAVREIASLSKEIISLASEGNEVALSLVQEATTSIADYIVELSNKLNYKSKSLIISANGSVIKNVFFRKALNDALQFNFKEIKWIFSKIPPAFGAAILAARYKNINIKLSNIIDKGAYFDTCS